MHSPLYHAHGDPGVNGKKRCSGAGAPHKIQSTPQDSAKDGTSTFVRLGAWARLLGAQVRGELVGRPVVLWRVHKRLGQEIAEHRNHSVAHGVGLPVQVRHQHAEVGGGGHNHNRVIC